MEWRFLGLKRLLPSVRGLAAAGPSGGDTASGVACTLAARSGPVGFPHGDWPSRGAPIWMRPSRRLGDTWANGLCKAVNVWRAPCKLT